MDDRQRQFAQLATAFNQYANTSSGNGERGPRERTATDGRSSTGSTSSGSSSSSGNAAAAALLGDLSRAFPFNYPGFSSGSGWPSSSHQGGSEYHRYGVYGSFNEGASENRNMMENRTESRRVPSKGETKATPPLPPGLSPNVGTALASLQQLVALPNDDVYRTLLAQHYASAAALSALPPNQRPPLSPIPPSSHSAPSPNQIHGNPSRHHQQLDKHLQYQMQQRQRQQISQQQKSSPPPPLPMISTVGGHAMASANSPDGGSLNGEYLDPLGRGHPQSQLSPLARKERLGEHSFDGTHGGLRHSPNPTPPKSSSISPVGRLTPLENDRDSHYGGVYGGEKSHQGDISMRGQDGGARSGSESEGDQRVRHKRKQDQPRRQTVIYPNSGINVNSVNMNNPPPDNFRGASVSAESSSDDSEGYDALLNRPSHSISSSIPPMEPLRNSSPSMPLSNDSPTPSSLPISQAMSHVLSHPFLAAHLNTSHNALDRNINKMEQHHPHNQYRSDYDIPASMNYAKDGNMHISSHYKEYDMTPHNKTQDVMQYQQLSCRNEGKNAGNYAAKNHKDSTSLYRTDQEFQELDRGYNLMSQQQMIPKEHKDVAVYENRELKRSEEISKNSYYHSVEGVPVSEFSNEHVPKINSPHYSSENRVLPSHKNQMEKSEFDSETVINNKELGCDNSLKNKQSFDHLVNKTMPNRNNEPVHSDCVTDTSVSVSAVNTIVYTSSSTSTTQSLLTTTSTSSSNTMPCVNKANNEPLCKKDLPTSGHSCSLSVSNVVEPDTKVSDEYSLESDKSEKIITPSIIKNNSIEKSEVGSVSEKSVNEENVSLDDDKCKTDNKTTELKSSEVMVNGLSSPPSLPISEDKISKNLPDPSASKNESDKGSLGTDNFKDSLEVFNGSLENILSPNKKNKKKSDCDSLEDSVMENCENKRRTRQKRPVSYVEDETDPVLETNEDMYPLSPVKKRGRKCKEKSEELNEENCSPSVAAARDARNQFYEIVNQNETSVACRDASVKLPPGDGLLQISDRIPPGITEPLHVDTSLNPFKANLHHIGPHSMGSKLHSPDIYDFNDGDGEAGTRGVKGKRGRKKGSPNKPGPPTPEYMRCSVSPRYRDGNPVHSPRSPKFLNSLKSPSQSSQIHGNCTDNSQDKDNTSSVNISSESPCPYSTGTTQSSDIPFLHPSANKSLEMVPVIAPPPQSSSSPSSLLSNNSKIIDEVEMQLAALHKEHISDAKNKTNPAEGEPILSGSDDKEKSCSEPKAEAESKPVHKPMLSVVPLEQLTYEGLKNKSTSDESSPSIKNDSERMCKSPSNYFADLTYPNSPPEPPPHPLLANHNINFEDYAKMSSPVNQNLYNQSLMDCNSLNSRVILNANDKLNLEVIDPSEEFEDGLEYPCAEGHHFPKRGGFKGRRQNRGRGGRSREQVFSSDRNYQEGEVDPVKGIPEDPLKDKGICNSGIDPQLIDDVVAQIPVAEQRVQVVSVSSDVASVDSSRGVRVRKRGGCRGRNSSTVERPSSSGREVDPLSSQTEDNENPDASNGESLLNSSETSPESFPRLRRSRRSTTNPRIEAHGSPTSSPQHLNTFSPIGRSDDVQSSVFDNRVPPSHDTLDSDMNANVGNSTADPQPSQRKEAEPEEGETLEDIAKFLEATAPTVDQKSSPKNSSFQSEFMSNISGSSIETGTPSSSTAGESSYREGRPKRVSRPPPEMNEGEMNDLFLLLNMEDEESEDEDYIPKDIEGLDSEGHGSAEEDGDMEDSELEDALSFSVSKSGSSSDLGHDGKVNRNSIKKKKEKINLKKSCSKKAKEKGKSSKRKLEEIDRKRDDGKKKCEDKYDRKGPIIKCVESAELEVILNAPNREDEDHEKNKKFSIPFYLDLESVAKNTKVGFNSTLHNNYDAFNKDLSWFCAFCKNYSHYRTLGDLFGPFFIKGLKLIKKNYPEVVDGQVTEIALSPTPSLEGSGLPTSKHKSKRTPKHDSSYGDASLEAKKLEMGGCSPPSRFVPSATPARMLGRGGATPNSPRVSLHSPLRSSHSTPTSATAAASSSQTGDNASVANPPGTECWMHESCTLWASGITTVNSKLCGLEEAVLSAQDSVCNLCGETGATVCCLARGCSLLVHVPCARLYLWTLDTRTFQSFCPNHGTSSKVSLEIP